MKQKALIITAILFFLIVNTTYFWEGRPGFFAMPAFLALVLVFLVLSIILLRQIFLAVKEKPAGKQRLLVIGVLTAVLCLTFFFPAGLINFDKLSGDDLLVAQREGVANCTTTFKLKANGRFTEKNICFGITEITGHYQLVHDTIYFNNVEPGRGGEAFYTYAVIRASAFGKGKDYFELVRFKNNNDTTGHILGIIKNDLPTGLVKQRPNLKGGEVFEALHDIQVNYLTHFMAPYTGGDKAKLLKGERIIISKPGQTEPSGYYCYPVNAGEVENRIIPDADKQDPAYNGFSLSIDTQSLHTGFKRIALKPIQFIKGDATNAVDSKTKIIVHICNDVGSWGKGFAMAISKKWKQPETEYRNWYRNKEGHSSADIQFEQLESRDKYANEKEFRMGNVQFVKVAEDTWVANMIARRDIKADKDGQPPIRYTFVSECLERVVQFAKRHKAGVHMPGIGSDLAGGQWNEIEEIINNGLIAHEIETTVHDLE